MAGLAVMEETKTRRDRREEARTLSAEERAHAELIPENYRKLLFDDAPKPEAPVYEREAFRPEAYAPVREAAPVLTTIPREEQREGTEMRSNTAQRLADYVAYPAGSKKVLFEGLDYKNLDYRDGAVIDTRFAAPAPQAEAIVMPAEPAFAPAEQPAEFTAEAPAAEEDALPTRRTLETLNRAEARTQTEQRARFLSALSLKTKLVLCAVAAAIVLAIVLICLNTGFLGTANASVAEKQARLDELTQSYTQVREELASLRDPANVAEWAEAHGMVQGL